MFSIPGHGIYSYLRLERLWDKSTVWRNYTWSKFLESINPYSTQASLCVWPWRRKPRLWENVVIPELVRILQEVWCNMYNKKIETIMEKFHSKPKTPAIATIWYENPKPHQGIIKRERTSHRILVRPTLVCMAKGWHASAVSRSPGHRDTASVYEREGYQGENASRSGSPAWQPRPRPSR